MIVQLSILMKFNETRWSPEGSAHDTTLINMGEGPRGQG